MHNKHQRYKILVALSSFSVSNITGRHGYTQKTTAKTAFINSYSNQTAEVLDRA